MSGTDWLTFAVAVGFTPIWLAREFWTLRHEEHPISVVLRRTGWQFSAFVFFWCAMPVHFWVPVPWGATVPGSIAFWAIIAGMLVWNVATWKAGDRPLEEWPRWRLWLHFPLWYVLAGPIAAALLFPQTQFVPWAP